LTIFNQVSFGKNSFVTIVLLCLNFLFWMIAEIIGSTNDANTLIDFGALFGPLIAAGEFWRLVSSLFLHVGLLHLLFNSFALFIFGPIIENLFGKFRFIIIYLFSGVSGSLISLYFNPLVVAAGASGAIFGLLGALAAFFLLKRNVLGVFAQKNFIAVIILVAFNMFFGFLIPGVDNFAHLGGFISGLIIALVLVPVLSIENTIFSPIFSYRKKLSVSRYMYLPVIFAGLIVIAFISISNIPDNVYTRFAKAEKYFQDGQYNMVIKETDEVVSIFKQSQQYKGMDPSNLLGSIFYFRGIAYVNLGDKSLAVKEFGSAVRYGDSEIKEKSLREIKKLD